jgi:hypothetical protein
VGSFSDGRFCPIDCPVPQPLELSPRWVFERLRDGLLAAITGIEELEAALITGARTYVRLGLENPALYRLMFGPALADIEYADRPLAAGAEARAV